MKRISLLAQMFFQSSKFIYTCMIATCSCFAVYFVFLKVELSHIDHLYLQQKQGHNNISYSINKIKGDLTNIKNVINQQEKPATQKARTQNATFRINDTATSITNAATSSTQAANENMENDITISPSVTVTPNGILKTLMFLWESHDSITYNEDRLRTSIILPFKITEDSSNKGVYYTFNKHPPIYARINGDGNFNSLKKMDFENIRCGVYLNYISFSYSGNKDTGSIINSFTFDGVLKKETIRGVIEWDLKDFLIPGKSIHNKKEITLKPVSHINSSLYPLIN